MASVDLGELSYVMIECPRQIAIERRLHVELALGDTSFTRLPRSSFDLVHARLVLSHILAASTLVRGRCSAVNIPRRGASLGAALDQLATALKPRGGLIVEEVDNELPICRDPVSERQGPLSRSARPRSGFEVRTYRTCRRSLMFHQMPELGRDPVLVRSTVVSAKPVSRRAPWHFERGPYLAKIGCICPYPAASVGVPEHYHLPLEVPVGSH